MTPRRFTQRDLDRLFALRDIEGLKWREIGKLLGRDAATCCSTYHYFHAKQRAALAGEEPAAPVYKPPIRRRTRRPFKAPAARTDAPGARPRYFHDADADLSGRIARQGLTAGFFGDPPAGRSALDRRAR